MPATYDDGSPRPDKDPRHMLAMAAQNLASGLAHTLEGNAERPPHTSDADSALGWLYVYQTDPMVPGVPQYVVLLNPRRKVLADDRAAIRQVERTRDLLTEWLETCDENGARDTSHLREAMRRLSGVRG